MRSQKKKGQRQTLVPVAVPQMDDATRKYLDRQAEEIRAIGGQAVWEIGKRVMAVRNRLRKVFDTQDDQPPGFVEWCRENFAWSVQQAYRLLRVAEKFPHKPPPSLIVKTASYYLTAPTAPSEALEEAVDRAMAGEKIGVQEAREILARHTPTIFGQSGAVPEPATDEEEGQAPVPPGGEEEAAPEQDSGEVEAEPDDEAEEPAGEDATEEVAAKPGTRPRQPYDASNGYRVVVWGVKGEALDPVTVKEALLEAAEKVVPAQQP